MGDGDKVGDGEVWPGGEGKETRPRCKKNWIQVWNNFHNFQLKVLNERQIQRLRLKAVRMGLHAEWVKLCSIISHFAAAAHLFFRAYQHEREVHSSPHLLILFLFQGSHRKIPGESDSGFRTQYLIKLHILSNLILSYIQSILSYAISAHLIQSWSSKPSLYFQPKVRMYSNFERRTDIRTYEDKQGLFSGVSWHAAAAISWSSCTFSCTLACTLCCTFSTLLLTFSTLPQPKIKTASKFERSTDYKSYEDKQRLFDGVSVLVCLRFYFHTKLVPLNLNLCGFLQLSSYLSHHTCLIVIIGMGGDCPRVLGKGMEW